MPPSPVTVKLLSTDDALIFDHVAEDVFGDQVRPDLVAEFLHGPRHHIAVALDDGVVVGMASAFHYVHPDKPPQLFINEVGVAPTRQRRGIASDLIALLLAHGRTLGCTEAWAATEEDNAPARALYAKVGGQEDPARAVVYTFPLVAQSGHRQENSEVRKAHEHRLQPGTMDQPPATQQGHA